MPDKQIFARLARRLSAPATTAAALLIGLCFLVLSLVLQLPGSVPYDGITVWYEAETGRLYAQHPAALVLLWRLASVFLKGPALFTGLQLLCLWAAAGVMIMRTRPPLWLALCFGFFLLVFPPLLAFQGVTVKDVFGAHLALLAIALALPDRRGPHSAGIWFTAFALAMLATLFRYQLGLVVIALGLLLWWEVRRSSGLWKRAVSGAVAGALATYGVVTLAVLALFTQSGSGDISLSLRKIMVFDIAGVVVNEPSAALPVFSKQGVDVVALKSEMRSAYSPVRVDTLWQSDGKGDSVMAPRGAYARLVAVPTSAIFKQWLQLSETEPLALLQHRAQAFARVLGFGPLYLCRPLLSGISQIPLEAAAYVGAKNYHPAFSATIKRSPFFPVGPLFRSWLYAMICLAIIAAGLLPGGVPRQAVLVAGFGLAYEISYFFLPQACEVRYSYPEILAAVFAVALVAFAWAQRRENMSE